MYLQLIFAISLLIPTACSALLGGHWTRSPFPARLSTSASVEEVEIHDLQSELNSEGINLCHGPFRVSTSASVEEVETHDLQSKLNAEGLNLCHGIMYASGVRELHK